MSTRAEILAQITSLLPDNNTRAISPTDLRTVVNSLANSYNNSTDEGTPAQAQAAAAADATAKVTAHNADAAAHGGVHGTPYLAPSGTLVSETKYILGMDNAGRIVANSGLGLYISADDGVTWTLVYTADVPPNGFRALSDGEVLLGVGENPGASKKASVWRSSGWSSGAPTFAKVLECSGYSQSFSLSWAWGHSGNIVVTNEYGTDSRYVYLSQDCGATWSTIYDNGVSATPQRHIHGCTYDPWRGAIWIAAGDWNGTEDNPHISVSWNLGVNWTKVTNRLQPTTIVPFPNCVCFGTDNAPNGVLRIRNPSASNLKVEVAYRLDEALTTTYVALGWYRKSDSDITLVYFGSGTAGTVATVLGSFNGFDWFRVWAGTADMSQAYRAVGPTPSGNIIIRYDLGSNRSTLRLPAPVNTIEAAADRAAAAASQAVRPPYAYFPNVSSPAYQAVTAYTNTIVQMTSIFGNAGSPFSYNKHDPDAMFLLDSDGLAVTVKRAGIVSISADGCFNSVGGVVGWTSILLNGVSLISGDGRCVSASLTVAAGDKIAVRVFTTTGTTLNGGKVLQLLAHAIAA